MVEISILVKKLHIYSYKDIIIALWKNRKTTRVGLSHM